MKVSAADNVKLAPAVAPAIGGNRPLRQQAPRASITPFPPLHPASGFGSIVGQSLSAVALYIPLHRLLLADEAGNKEVIGPHLPASLTVRPQDDRLEYVAGVEHFFAVPLIQGVRSASVREEQCYLLPAFQPEIGADGGWFRPEPARLAWPTWSGEYWFFLPSAGSWQLFYLSLSIFFVIFFHFFRIFLLTCYHANIIL